MPVSKPYMTSVPQQVKDIFNRLGIMALHLEGWIGGLKSYFLMGVLAVHPDVQFETSIDQDRHFYCKALINK